MNNFYTNLLAKSDSHACVNMYIYGYLNGSLYSLFNFLFPLFEFDGCFDIVHSTRHHKQSANDSNKTNH